MSGFINEVILIRGYCYADSDLYAFINPNSVLIHLLWLPLAISSSNSCSLLLKNFDNGEKMDHDYYQSRLT